MTASQRLLLSAGLAIVSLGMAYGFWYALVDEHPTLEGMGISLASAFVQAAQGNMNEARQSLEVYGATRYEYVREVHSHGHLAALSTMLLVLGLFFNQLAFAEKTRVLLASVLIFGTLALPFGAFLEIYVNGPIPSVLSGLGALAIIGGLGAAMAGLLRARG
jgi:hypothetical protein